MNEVKLESTCRRVTDIPWNEPIIVSKIMFDPNLFETHKQRIDKVFANASDEVKQQQLQNILMRDTLFNLAMDRVVQCYEFDIKESDIRKFEELLKSNLPNFGNNLSRDEQDQRIKEIAKKLIQKELIFNDIAKEYNITVDADETMKVLAEYQKSTGNSIDEIKADRNKLTGAVSALLEEKITAFIINSFKNKDFTELQRNIQLDNEMQQNKANATDSNVNNNENK